MDADPETVGSEVLSLRHFPVRNSLPPFLAGLKTPGCAGF